MKQTILIALIIILSASLVFQYFHYKDMKPIIQKVETVIKDTIYQKRIVTDTIYQKRFIDRIVRDTVFQYDTLQSIYHYKDSSIDIDIKAKELDWLKYSIHLNDTVPIIERNTVIRTRQKGLYYGIGVGIGYGLFKRNIDAYVGISVGYRF